ncbi:hypothetical protein SIRV1gp16 [Sulfolobus islandicus rod-shaped virus 1]|uniref:Uncharacterized protein 179 n=1 Tax=Sulfolobus islandicus rod-shaped virus 1 TaxID=157898 RepID=Y179_SIRV1|nr:hypothetical protein SIRV1gp16 [Sulfolobus islandicus rod-shaped virus 1]Q8QL38.1 RecName: Full=Uncharacterized protein 179 [Sulfolobus islandicus rod-shaped virus 1]CAC93971.1 hypothetical protein [Sulfolobus islandicus rod-shaped virus 1]
MSDEINKTQLKNIINAILEYKRVLVYRNEINGDIDNSYVLFYNEIDSNFDILTIPFVIENLREEKEFLKFLYESELFDIDNLSKLIVDFIDYKHRPCLLKGLVYVELLDLIKQYNYQITENNINFNKNRFTGEIRYIISIDSNKTAEIIKKIEYCNFCLYDRDINVGIQKCVTYKLKYS